MINGFCLYQNIVVSHNLYFIVVSIERIPNNTDIKFPKETGEDNTTHFSLPNTALRSLSGIYGG